MYILGIITPTEKLFKQYVKEKLPVTDTIKYYKISHIYSYVGISFDKIIEGYSHHEIPLGVRLSIKNRVR